jgi:hypothetical protein
MRLHRRLAACLTLHVEGGLSTQPAGINAAGVVVGSYQQPQGRNVLLRPFVYDSGSYRPLRTLEPATHTFDDINDAGHLVTNKMHRDLRTEAALVAGGQRTVLAVAGAKTTVAYALNIADTVVGSYDHDPNPFGILTTSGFLWHRNGGFTTFDAPGSAGLTVAWGINAAEVVVGVYADANLVYHGFVRAADGTVTTVDVPGSPYTQLMGINSRGDIVGFYQDPADAVLKGFVLRGGLFEPITPPGASLGAYPYRITDDGRIVGWMIDDQGLVRGFLGTPVP